MVNFICQLGWTTVLKNWTNIFLDATVKVFEMRSTFKSVDSEHTLSLIMWMNLIQSAEDLTRTMADLSE